MIIKNAVTAFWLLVLVNLIWGVGFVVVDDAITEIPVNVFNAFRFGVAALALMPLWVFSKKRSEKNLIKNSKKLPHQQKHDNVTTPPKGLLLTGFGLGLFLFLGFFFQTQGLLHTTVSNTGFITGLSVPLVPIIGLLLYKTRVNPSVWGSVVLASIGLYFLTIGDKLSLNKGDILVAFGALCYAVHISITASVSGKYEVLALSIIQLIAVTCYSSVAAIVEMAIDHNLHFSALGAFTQSTVMAAIAYSAILSSAFALWAQTAGQRLIAPHKIALIFALEPIFAHIAAVYFLNESMGLKGWLGASLILTGMLFSELGGLKRDTKVIVNIQALDQTATAVEKPVVSGKPN